MRSGSWPWRSAVVLAAALVVAALPRLAAALALVRDPTPWAEPWRWWTGHLVHGSAYHLTWDAAALLALGFLFEGVLRERLWLLLALAAPVIGLGTLALEPGLSSYAGLSGLLNALWVAGALLVARGESAAGRRGLAFLFRAAVAADVAKIAVEVALGAPLFTNPALLGGVPVPLAHALGASSGALFAALAQGLAHHSHDVVQRVAVAVEVE